MARQQERARRSPGFQFEFKTGRDSPAVTDPISECKADSDSAPEIFLDRVSVADDSANSCGCC